MSWIVLKFIILSILLFLSAFFSGSETALVAIGKIKARALLKKGVRSAEVIQKLIEEPNVFLTTVLIGNNIVNVAASAIATSIAIDYFGSYGVGIATGVMVFLILTFGEIMPKTIALHHAEKISIIASKPLYILSSILRPVIKFFSFMVGVLHSVFGIKEVKKPLVSEEEVVTILDIGEEEGVLEKEEKEMIKRVLAFNDTMVRNIMKDREEMVCIEANKSLEEAIDLIKRSGYSRIPVFEGDRDNIIGILYAKDILMHGDKCKGGVSLKEMIKPAYFVEETKMIDDLLKELQQGRVHIAIVVDKEGKVKGLVTLEDILEEIVGSIYDEYDIQKMRRQRVGEEAMKDARMEKSGLES
ncbi:MAG: hemolysin family protein [Candidatus Methanospirareceae archaeon]